MTKFILQSLGAAALLCLYACQDPQKPGTTQAQSFAQLTTTSWGEPFIPVDSANNLISSYLTSVNYQSSDSSVRSFIIDANALREYLTVGSGLQISGLKVMLAHNADYIQSGHYGLPCGYSKDALTVVLAGYGDDGNYIYAPGNKVMDYSMPCPANCPKFGSAVGDLLPN